MKFNGDGSFRNRFLSLSLSLAVLLLGGSALAVERVKLVLSVDWEGSDLRTENLNAMKVFRNKHPDIRLVHFLNAAYFTQAGVDAAETREKIASVIRPGDELGLHIHGWEGLFTAAGVAFRDRPTFWGREASQDGVGGRGHDVPIDEYSIEELRKVIRFSVSILDKNGFHGIRSFRAGGWMAGPSVLAALAAEGFMADSSAVPPDLLVDRVGGTPLHQRAQALWSHISRFSQPYAITTELGGSLTEFPDNACLADYVIGDQVVQLFRRMADQPASRGVPILHYGFHQETAAEYLIRVEESLELIDKAAKEKGVTWSSEVLLGAP